MTFADLNQSISQAQIELEKAIRTCITAEDELDLAKIVLVQKESAKKKARLEMKLAQERMNSLKEQSWNTRKEASI